MTQVGNWGPLKMQWGNWGPPDELMGKLGALDYIFFSNWSMVPKFKLRNSKYHSKKRST